MEMTLTGPGKAEVSDVHKKLDPVKFTREKK